MITPTSTTAAATTTGYVDTLGFSFVSIDVHLGTADAVSNNPTTLKLTEGETTYVTSSSAITALTGDGTGGFTIPNCVTAGDYVVKLEKEITGASKRYLFVSVAPLTTQIITAFANLYGGDELPVTAAQRGVNAVAVG